MTLAALPIGLIYPATHNLTPGAILSVINGLTLDATGEKAAFIGHCYIEGRATSKTISAAGGGAIQWRTATITFANGGTTLDVGIQDVDAAAGPPVRPDNTFDVKATLTGGGGALVTNTWTTTSMTGGTGSKTISHGDLIAIVWDMTARAGVDSVVVTALNASPAHSNRPVSVQFLAAAWATASGTPMAVITFDDGTLGYIDGYAPLSAVAAELFADATNPDERGLMFTMPWDCKIDALALNMASAGATGDGTIKLWSDPTGTPALVTSVAVLGEQWFATTNRWAYFTLPAEISLTKNTVYGLTLLATGAGNVGLGGFTLGNEAHRAFYGGGTTQAKITRNNSTGAFAAESPAITQYSMGVRISQFDDGTGAGASAGGGSVFGSKGGIIT